LSEKPSTTGPSILNEVEEDFIEFLVQRDGATEEEVRRSFLELKGKFEFDGKAYRNLCTDFLDLHSILYNKDDERHLVRLYRRIELLSVLRFISYSYMMDKRPPHRLEKSVKRLFRKEEHPIDLNMTKRERMADEARFLVEQAGGRPVVVDYGCGLAYMSFQIAEMYPGAAVHLVDIDTLNLRFAEYRFRKRGVEVNVITVSEDELYPALPEHDICIATEVVEHVREPLTLYGNITSSLKPGGVLLGDFSDHEPDRYHVSHRLGELREKVRAEYREVGRDLYKKL